MSIVPKECLVSPNAGLREVFYAIQQGNKQIALVVDDDHRLLGIITDGDARRAILADKDLSEKASSVMNSHFIFGRPGMSPEEIRAVFWNTRAGHIPLLDDAGRIVGLIWYKDFQAGQPHMDVTAVVMAGGLGSRLMPLTKDTPKPLLHVGARPIVEDILDQLGSYGLGEAYLTTCHMKSHFVEYFRQNSREGMNIRFLEESKPLGTAGGLSLLEPSKTILVINGDILTRMDFSAMHAFHMEHGADITVAIRRYEMQVPYGVLHTEKERLVTLEEKPVYTLNVNAGIYMIEPGAHELIPKNENCQMTDLISTAMERGMKVLVFPVIEYWLDIGTKGDYDRAQTDIEQDIIREGVCQTAT